MHLDREVTDGGPDCGRDRTAQKEQCDRVLQVRNSHVHGPRRITATVVHPVRAGAPAHPVYKFHDVHVTHGPPLSRPVFFCDRVLALRNKRTSLLRAPSKQRTHSHEVSNV